MRLKPIYIQILIVTVILLVAANQLIWISNMYRLYKRELIDLSNQTIEKVVLMELHERSETMGGYSVYSSNFSNPNDTSRYFTKNVKTADSTYVFTIDKHDPNTMNKIIQFVFQEFFPVNLDKLNSLFKQELSSRYPIQKTFFNYLNLQTGEIINTNRPELFSSNYVATDTIPLDIISSIGVIGYIEVPELVILRKMSYQLILSVMLILIGIGGLVYLGKSFIIQWRLEKLRQLSVNAMTHEFKRPISGAMAMVSLIPMYIERNDFQKVTKYAENTLTELNKLTAYTKRIQQISNNEKGQIRLDIVRVELIPLVNSLIEKYNFEEEGKIVRFSTEIKTNRSEIQVDLLHFTNVLDNLIENAIKYSGKTVNIILTVSDESEKLKFEVKDDGMGIDSYDQKHVFNRFYRSSRKEMANKVGFGLGLTYVKSIIEEHGGTVSVESKLHQGSTFTVLI